MLPICLWQSLPNKQLVLMADDSFQAAVYAFLIKDDPNQMYKSTRKIYVPVAYGSKTFIPSQIKISIHAKEFLARYLGQKEFGHVLWDAAKRTTIMTDIKSVTGFFQTKMIPPPLWNACDFLITHIRRKGNIVADFPARLKSDTNEEIFLKMREVITIKLIEININSAGIASEEPFFHTDNDPTETPSTTFGNAKLKYKTTSSQPSVITIASYYHLDLPNKKSVINMAHFSKPS